MKKLLMTVLLGVVTITLSGCDLFGGKEGLDPTDVVPDKVLVTDECDGLSDYIIINGQCVVVEDILSDQITLNSDKTVSTYTDSIELMNNFVADLSGSTGLAVVSRDVFDSTVNDGSASLPSLLRMSNDTQQQETTTEMATENLIVKLTEDGFFEEVDFTTESGEQVDITSNPLALEVFGPWTIVVFEVNLGYGENYNPTFDQRVWDSLYAGGIYLIYNETGKMFATKDVTYTENSWTYTEDHSRTITVEATLNEQVAEIQQVLRVDENGNPVLDENQNEIWDEVSVPLFDENGDPIIFTEGPIVTEMVDVPVVETYKVQQIDENGELVFDENGEPVYDIVDEPVLDENGNPVMETQEVAVTDENGDPVYQQTFEVQIYIQDIVEVTQVEYYSTVTDNPISSVAQRFVDQVIAEYYDWNYYRVSNYSIQHWGFAETANYIYFMETHPNVTDPNTSSQFVMRLGYDSDTNELLLEEYINASKAGFDNCEVIIDPINENIICDPYDWDQDIKVYSATTGLSTIEDSGQLTPVTFPNGELYFYEQQETYVAELGYYTTMLYSFNADGTLEPHYIELGERQQLCTIGEGCTNGMYVDYYDENGNKMNEWDYWLNLHFANGDPLISDVDVTVQSIDDFDSTRPACEDAYCWYSVFYQIEDSAGNLVAEFEQGVDGNTTTTVPDYGYTYTLDGTETYTYEMVWGTDNETCDNAAGCVDDMYFRDGTITQNGLYLSQINAQIVPQGTDLIQSIVMNDTNNATYVYSKDVEGEVCPAEYTSCEETVLVYFYDIDGTPMNEQWNQQVYIDVPGGETIPLYIEYTITDSSTTTLEEGICTSSDGCWRYYLVEDGVNLSAYYEQGDSIYATIDNVDKNTVTQETLTSEVCMDVDGCSMDQEIYYTIVDPNGNVLYEFSTWAWEKYGERLPFSVTAVYDENDATASDVEVMYQKVSTSEVKTCTDDVCGNWVEYVIATGTEYQYEHLGNAYRTFANGEQIITRVTFAEGTEPTATQTQNICRNDNGCSMSTQNFSLYDVDGNEYFADETWSQQYMEVFFNKGDVIPVDNDFHVTFQLNNIEYQMRRLYVYDFIYNLNNVVILEDNLYLIERESWSEGDDNVILTFNETTGNYAAMYTNLTAVKEITKLGDNYFGINDSETGIYKFTFDATQSSSNYYYFIEENLTEGLSINGVNDLIVDYDGSIYFKGVDNFIQDITGTILEDGTVSIDTEFTEPVIIRLRPIN